MVDLGTNDKSFGRIKVNLSAEEAFSISKSICKDLKLNIQEIDSEKLIIKGKTKLSWTKNKFAQKFWVLINSTQNLCYIDVCYGALGITGVDTGPLINPFYKKFCEKTSSQPDLETSGLSISDEGLENRSNDISNLDTVDPIVSNEPEQQEFVQPVSNTNIKLSSTMSATQLRELTKTLHNQYKAQWDKNGVVQFKSDSIAILQRMWGQQVQFIVACDQLTKEGYRLMAIDEGKTGSSGGLAGGVNAYFYFQKIDFVR